jgi:hypothetical protein
MSPARTSSPSERSDAIASVDVQTIFRAALAACASAIVLGHYVPRHIMSVLFPPRLCVERFE